MPRRYEPEPSAAKVGARLRELRVERNMSPAELSAASGFTKTQITRLEYGLNAITAETITRLAKTLNVRDFDLLTFPADGELARTAELIRKLPLAEVKKLRRQLTKSLQAAAREQATRQRK